MKKINYNLVCLLFILLVINNHAKGQDLSKEQSTSNVSQVPYKSSIGGKVLVTNAVGPSFKTFISEKIAFQSDLVCKYVFTAHIDKIESFCVAYTSLENITNVMYEDKCKKLETNVANIFWFLGGGVSIGHEYHGYGKFGINTISGLELVFKQVPLAFQFDIQPGCGMLYYILNEREELGGLFFPTFTPNTNPWFHFDWTAGFTLRYTFK